MRQFTIEMLPAREGDCLWIEYGEPASLHRVLVDGGTKGTYTEIKKRLNKLEKTERHFDLLVISHIDTDHIDGAIKLLKSRKLGVSFDDIWFNGYRHLPGALETFGPVQGEKVSRTLDRRKMPWNEKFGENRVNRVSLDEGRSLPSKTLKGGMKLTLLSPNPRRLRTLRNVWKQVCAKHGIDPSAPKPMLPPPPPAGYEAFGPPDIETLATTPFVGDKSEANGSSIAFLAEYDGRTALLAGDAYAEDLYGSITNLVGPKENKKLKLDAFKVPHHGSRANINQELLGKIDCRRYLISTNGGGTRRQHPHTEAIARIVKFGSPKAKLVFNYKTQYNQMWDVDFLMGQYEYSVSYPSANAKAATVSL